MVLTPARWQRWRSLWDGEKGDLWAQGFVEGCPCHPTPIECRECFYLTHCLGRLVSWEDAGVGGESPFSTPQCRKGCFDSTGSFNKLPWLFSDEKL